MNLMTPKVGPWIIIMAVWVGLGWPVVSMFIMGLKGYEIGRWGDFCPTGKRPCWGTVISALLWLLILFSPASLFLVYGPAQFIEELGLTMAIVTLAWWVIWTRSETRKIK